ncbi:MAG TPA: ATPase, T2SS/T4P/T4SS family, partial [Acidimicrobiia bacterium]|nr:ATPase, T2SS/T4P/T4SS family [Acidimicrobiia bacterium]
MGEPDGSDLDQVVVRIHTRLLAASTGAPGREVIDAAVRTEVPLLDVHHQRRLARRVADHFDGLGLVQPLLDDPEVTDVYIDGPGEVSIERRGRVHRPGVRIDAVALAHLIERLIAPSGRRVDVASPIVDARLTDGSRVNV